jgi:hypothetical protein
VVLRGFFHHFYSFIKGIKETNVVTENNNGSHCAQSPFFPEENGKCA